ncbi:glutathione S-transferase [Sphingobium yanoikuyae]|jgi:glutathione S-transferase|uniref:glutathione S-transferase n=1 Tax=Sphingobium yanoikuyae TaxID=13690 RepID=UPI003F041D90
MADAPILYSFRRCPYAMRARLALLVSGQAVAHREILLRAKPAAMLAASPKGTVPVLVLSDGRVIDESLEIMRWALGRHDPEAWLAGDDATLIATNDGPFKRHLDRYKYAERHGSDPIAHRTEAAGLLDALEARLRDRAQLCGARRTLADMAIFPFVRQFAAVEPDWFAAQPWAALRGWLAGHLESELFDRAMVRHPLWVEAEAG